MMLPASTGNTMTLKWYAVSIKLLACCLLHELLLK